MPSPFATFVHRRPTIGQARLVEGTVAGVWLFLRLVLFSDVLFPLTFVIPMLLCIWAQDLTGLWAMALVFAVAAWVEIFAKLPDGSISDVASWSAFLATLLNVAVGAIAVHVIIRFRSRLDAANQLLTRQVVQLQDQEAEIRAQSEELAQQNEDLTQQAEELSRQSEELGQQTEELSQVNEELSSQNEELQEQSAEVRSLNDVLGRREALLQLLLDCTRLARPEAEALEDVCRATMDLFAGSADAAVVYERAGELLVLRGAAGLAEDMVRSSGAYGGGRFAEVVLDQNRTAALDDTALRPDMAILQVPGQPRFRSVLGSPLRRGTVAHGVICVYGLQTRAWTQEQFKLLEWLAAQCSQILETLRLQEDLRRQAAIIDLTPNALLVRTVEGVISRWSRGAEQIYGFTAGEAIGRVSHDLLATRFPQPLAEIEATLVREGHWAGDLVHRARDGAEIVVESRWLLRPGRDGLADEVLESNVDVTGREQSKDALRHANQVKDEFLATLSHELRTPLNAIVGWSQMLRRGGLDEVTTQKAIDVIARNAQAQNRLIEDVLDVSRIVTGKLRLDAEPCAAVPLIDSAVESVLLAAEAKGITIERDISPVLPTVIGDAARLQQVFWNLLSNAMKFTPAGGRVKVSAWQEASQLKVSVRDTGIGITPEFLPRVFDRFSQHDGSTSRIHSGLGLGLAIVRHLVELHGGTVCADSAGADRGACFTVTLPVRAVFPSAAAGGIPARDRSVTATTVDEGDLGGLRVLVVDDEPEARELVEAVLRGAGAEVTLAERAREALERFASGGRFDLVITDVGMPDLDGYGLLQALKHQRVDVPVIALTAYGGADESRRASASGFRSHLVKPVLPETLLAEVIAVAAAIKRNARQHQYE